jgi:hypothetical protein
MGFFSNLIHGSRPYVVYVVDRDGSRRESGQLSRSEAFGFIYSVYSDGGSVSDATYSGTNLTTQQRRLLIVDSLMMTEFMLALPERPTSEGAVDSASKACVQKSFAKLHQAFPDVSQDEIITVAMSRLQQGLPSILKQTGP